MVPNEVKSDNNGIESDNSNITKAELTIKKALNKAAWTQMNLQLQSWNKKKLQWQSE